MKKKPNGYWTYDRCKEEALKYSSKIDFKTNCNSAYHFSRINNWLNDICLHMVNLGHKYRRCIYSFEFSDDCVYVGLTYNANIRKIQHLNNKNSIVYKHMKKTGLIPIFYQLTEYISVNDAKTKENEYVFLYKNKGWEILNTAKTGGVGCSKIYWSKEKCLEESLKYDNCSDFFKNNKSAYASARKHGWLNEIYLVIPKNRKSPNYWTKKRCHDEALKFNTKIEFSKKSSSAYNSAVKNKWMFEICSHMTNNGNKPRKYWNKEKCREEALKYSTIDDMKKDNIKCYNAAIKMNCLKEICQHMLKQPKKRNYWTKEKCQEEALKYNTKVEFKINNINCYKLSYKKGWMSDICSHMN